MPVEAAKVMECYAAIGMCFSVWGLRAMFMALEGFGGIGFLCYYQLLSSSVDSNGRGARLLPRDSVPVENSQGQIDVV